MSDGHAGRSLATAAEHLGYQVHRVWQTWRFFENWFVLLGHMAGMRGRGELEFRTRSGLRILSANVPGARLPLYEQFADDCYHLQALLQPLPGRPLAVLDIGSHVGCFALRVAQLRTDAQVDCFEPSPWSADYLKRNVDANGFADRISVHEAAVAAFDGLAQLDDNASGSVHNGIVQSDGRLVSGNDFPGHRRLLTVSTTTFDAVVAAMAHPPALVKMDCEGSEYELVRHSSPSSWTSVHAVVLEYHPVSGHTWDELETWFAAVGLTVQRHDALAEGLGTVWLTRDPVGHS